MTGIGAKSALHLINYHKLFVDEFIEHMERKLKENFDKGKKRAKV